MGCVPFNQPLGNRNVAGDFHRPYETQNVLHFTVQLGLSQSGCKKVYEFIVAWEF